MQSFHGAPELARAWGREGRAFAHWPVAARLPIDRAGLTALLEAAPPPMLELRRSGREPGDSMPDEARPQGIAELLDWLHSRALVMRVGNLERFCAAARQWVDDYRALLVELFGARDAELSDVRADLYLAGPGGVSRFHADPSHNILHQAAGRRSVHVFSPQEERLINAETRPMIFLSRGVNPPYRAECEASALHFDLGPGEAAYLPLLGGHWFANGKELSVAYGISLRTPSVMREKLCHRFNARFGLTRIPYGTQPKRERCKAHVEAFLQRVLPVR